MAHAILFGCNSILRYRYPCYPAKNCSRQLRVSVGRSDCPLRSLSFVHRRTDFGLDRTGIRLAHGAGVILFCRSRPVFPGTAQEEMDPGISRHVRRGSATQTQFAPARAGNHVAVPAICRGGPAVSEENPVAGECSSDHAPFASEAPRIL